MKLLFLDFADRKIYRQSLIVNNNMIASDLRVTSFFKMNDCIVFIDGAYLSLVSKFLGGESRLSLILENLLKI